MAVTQTGAIYKALTFDGTSSRLYGVYITGEAVYNAPERDVEMISIPGRNGAFALDKGRFENVTVSYPAGIYADTEADFAQAVSDFRNFLCSKKGYCRLTDDYNTGEYRMAIYKSGLEVSPAMLRAGEFVITFECKPQRWLTSGETGSIVNNNGTVTNPTLFPSSPMLKVKGYGSVTFGGQTITVINKIMGEVLLSNLFEMAQTSSGAGTGYIVLDRNQYNTGDLIYSKNAYLATSAIEFLPNASLYTSDGPVINLSIPSSKVITAGTNTAIDSSVASGTFTLTKKSDSSTYTVNYSVYLSVLYDQTSPHNDVYVLMTWSLTGTGASLIKSVNAKDVLYPLFVDSTISGPGNPTYIDMDLGEAYKIVNGSPVSLNNVVSIPAQLPTLAPGANTITKDNTITQLEIVPRWWKV